MSAQKGRSISQLHNGLKIHGKQNTDGSVDLIHDASGNVVLGFDAAGVLYGTMNAPKVQAAVATTDGLTTGIVSPNATHVSVTSASSSNIITLPAPVVGKKLVIDVGATGFKLQTTAPSTIGINGGTGSTAKSTVAASSTIELICVSLTSWKAIFWDADSDVAKLPAAA